MAFCFKISIVSLCLDLSSENRRNDDGELTSRVDQASEKQGVVAVSFLFSPVVAAVVPAAGAAAIGVYGVYGDSLRRLYNSIFREFI